MASVVMHLAMAGELVKACDFTQPQLFRFGCLLPDAPRPEEMGRKAHFLACRDGWRTYDLEAFRQRYGQRLREEGLYLGYELHLIQDIIYRRFQYRVWQWGRLDEAGKQQLYEDYSRLNHRLIRHFGLGEDLRAPAGIEEESVCRQFSQRPLALMEELHGYFSDDPPPGEPAFFTWEMAREYMSAALALCQKEVKVLRAGEALTDPWALAWKPAVE